MLFIDHQAIMNIPLPRDIGKPFLLWMSPIETPGSYRMTFPEFLVTNEKRDFPQRFT